MRMMRTCESAVRVLKKCEGKEEYFPFRRMLRLALVSKCARAVGVSASLHPSLPYDPKRADLEWIQHLIWHMRRCKETRLVMNFIL
jgi:hypothetical protein